MPKLNKANIEVLGLALKHLFSDAAHPPLKLKQAMWLVAIDYVDSDGILTDAGIVRLPPALYRVVGDVLVEHPTPIHLLYQRAEVRRRQMLREALIAGVQDAVCSPGGEGVVRNMGERVALFCARQQLLQEAQALVKAAETVDNPGDLPLTFWAQARDAGFEDNVQEPRRTRVRRAWLAIVDKRVQALRPVVEAQLAAWIEAHSTSASSSQTTT